MGSNEVGVRGKGGVRSRNAWVDLALVRMTLDGLPPGAEELEPAEMELLALCRELQQLNHEQAGREDFILPVRAAAKALDGFDAKRDVMRVHRLLTGVFVAEGWVEVVTRGKGQRGSPASVYRFLGGDA